MWVTDSPKVMLAREVHFRKASSPMWVTDSGIVSTTSRWEFWKAALEMFVTLKGIFTPKYSVCVWISCFAAASASFLVYATVTRDSAPKNLAELSDSASSMIEQLCNSSTLRTLRSIGSWQGCFSRSINFNSRTVAVIRTSRAMTPPCRVLSLISQDMAPNENKNFCPPNFARAKTAMMKNHWGGHKLAALHRPKVKGASCYSKDNCTLYMVGRPNRTWVYRLECI